MTTKMRFTRHFVRRTLLSLLVLSFFSAMPASFAQQKSAPAADDVLLSAMRAELDRSKSQLKMDQVAAPYYVEYRI